MIRLEQLVATIKEGINEAADLMLHDRCAGADECAATEHERRQRLAAADELVARANFADAYKYRKRAEELQDECHQWNALYGRLDKRRRDAEARADELQRKLDGMRAWLVAEMDKARKIDAKHGWSWPGDSAIAILHMGMGNDHTIGNLLDDAEQARREADQLRAALDSALVDPMCDPWTVERIRQAIARAALAGVQASGSGSSAAAEAVGERQGRQPDPEEIAAVQAALRWYEDHKRDDGSYDGEMWGDLATLAGVQADNKDN